MKKILVTLICFFFLSQVSAQNLYLFYSEECPHCEAEQVYLETLKEEYSDLNIIKYEVSKNVENYELFKLVNESYSMYGTSVPVTIIGKKYLLGYSSTTTESEIENKLKYCEDIECQDVVGEIIKNNTLVDITKDTTEETLTLPILGEVNTKKASLLLMSIVLGFVDGFNPCAMWILIFLISFLITMKDRKRMWLLGTVFIMSSAIIYMFFMLSWLTISVELTKITFIRDIIALLAIGAGMFNLYNYFKSRKEETGCKVVDSKKRIKIIERIKKFVLQKNIFIAIFGIIALAFSVNLIELTCSLGLPVVFTGILSLNNLSPFMYAVYIMVYVLFFLIDDLIIFIIAMVTFRVTGISNKYTKYSHLIGGLIMFIAGILLIFKSEWIMFNF